MTELFSSNITARYLARKAMVTTTPLESYAALQPRWNDDFTATLDYVYERRESAAASPRSARDDEPLLDSILQGYDPDRGYILAGMSFGAAAAASACHRESSSLSLDVNGSGRRCLGVVSMDGTHMHQDLFMTDIGVPQLLLTSETPPDPDSTIRI